VANWLQFDAQAVDELPSVITPKLIEIKWRFQDNVQFRE
jgi:hypothetical protein